MTGAGRFGRRVSGWAREVIARRALIVAAVAGGAHFAVARGWMPGDWSQTAEDTTTGLIDLVGLVAAVFWARTGTTPADPALQPMSTNGVPLVEDHNAASSTGR